MQLEKIVRGSLNKDLKRRSRENKQREKIGLENSKIIGIKGCSFCRLEKKSEICSKK